MRVCVPIEEGRREAVLERVQVPREWSSRVPGLREVVGRIPRLTLYFGGPRPFQCVIQVTVHDDGLVFDLEEGEPRSFAGRVTVHEDTLEIDVSLDVGRTVPGMLQTTLETDLVQRLANNLVR